MPTSSVAEALASVQNRIAIATRQSGRDDTAVRLIAISKTKPPELLRDAVAVGQLVFGENRVQEALEKMEELADLPVLAVVLVQTQEGCSKKTQQQERGKKFSYITKNS